MPILTTLLLSASLLAPETDLARQRVAFTSDRDGAIDVFVMSGDGAFPTRLTPCSDADKPEGWIKAVGPAWSPDGEHLAFHVYREEAPRALCVIGADGEGLRVLIDDRDATDACWSPGGEELVFACEGDLWIVEASGGEATRITESPSTERNPTWSPDGDRIAYCAGGFQGGQLFEEIHVMDLASGETRQLTELGGETSLPSWSPDGEWIAFNVGDDDSGDLHVMRPDGGERRAVTRTGKLYGPSWSPDGSELYATGFFDANNDIYAQSLDGKRLRRLSKALGREDHSAVCPVLKEARGKDLQGVNELQDLAALEARNAIALLREGTALMRAGQYAEAAAKLRAAVKQDPGFGRVWLRLGVAHMQAGDLKAAAVAFEKAASFRKYAGNANYNLACLQAKNGQAEQAIASLNRAIDSGFVNWGLLERDTDLDSLREDTRFIELLKRLN